MLAQTSVCESVFQSVPTGTAVVTELQVDEKREANLKQFERSLLNAISVYIFKTY